MKRLLILLLALCLLVVSVPAATQDCQNPSTMGNIAGYDSYVVSATGGNSYVSGTSAVSNVNAIPMSYMAVTKLGGSGGQINLYDSGHNLLWANGMAPAAGRLEMKMTGGQALIYDNGGLLATSPPLAANPSYVSWMGSAGGINLDDFVYGSTDSPYVFGMPEANAYVISRDFTNSAASGFYRVNVDGSLTLVNSNNMTTTFSKDNGNPETVYLANTDTGTVYATYNTSTAYTGSIAWDLDALFSQNAPMGRYRTYITGHGFSQSIFYIGQGAQIDFNSHTYSQGDVATIPYSVSTGAYWNTNLYNYRIIIQSIYAEEISNQPITTQTGSVSYTWTTADNPNVYYAIIQALDKTTGEVIWMNYDYTTLNAFATIRGIAHDGQTELPIPNASIIINQGSVFANSTTPADGNYTATGLYTGAVTGVNVTCGGYKQYNVSITPMSSSIQLNFTLYPLSPSVSGVGVGGVVRTGVLGVDNYTVTQGYGEPIPFAQVWFVNATTGENYYTLSNSVGGYLIDEAHGGSA